MRCGIQLTDGPGSRRVPRGVSRPRDHVPSRVALDGAPPLGLRTREPMSTSATAGSVWGEILESNLQRALGLMEAAVRDCPDEMWSEPMWPVPDPPPDGEVRGPAGDLVTDPADRHALVQLYATPWAVAWHALERLDFMLTRGVVPWEVWPGLQGRTGWTPPPARSVWDRPYGGLDITTLSLPWSRDDVLDFTAYCKDRGTETLKDLTEERATTRIGGRKELYVARVIDKMGHVIEHGAQIRQFITAAVTTADRPAGSAASP